MDPKRTFNTFQKDSNRRQSKQQTPRGCCCKRSQCIKNYCDCYQSMTTCSMYCKCVGCRNTVERMTLPPPPKKSTVTNKRERAAALSAKAAAAAAKAGIKIHMKPAPGSAAYQNQRYAAGAQGHTFAVPQQPHIIQLPDANLDNVIVLAPLNAAALVKKPTPPPIITPPPAPPIDSNILKRPINKALLEVLVAQATEAQGAGMNDAQVCQLVMLEFIRRFKDIAKAYLK